MMNKTIGVILKPSDIPILGDFLSKLYSELTQRSYKLRFEKSESERVLSLLSDKQNIYFSARKELLVDSSMIFTLGGDGTLIGTCRDCSEYGTPIVGVNLGRLGFMTEFTMNEVFDHLDSILDNKYVCSKVDVYDACIYRDERKQLSTSFINDAVIAKGGIARMFELSVSTETESIYKLIGDGLIISSAIGSTAYSMAAGGPILHRDVGGIILTPICPHSLTKRPLVVPDTTTLSIVQSDTASELTLTIDGQEVHTVNFHDKIKISKSNKHVELVLNPDRGFFKTLRDKFANSSRDI